MLLKELCCKQPTVAFFILFIGEIIIPSLNICGVTALYQISVRVREIHNFCASNSWIRFKTNGIR